MSHRRLLAVAIVFGVGGCVHRVTRPAPIACPSEPSPGPEAGGRANTRIKLDGPPPTPIFQGAYTIVVDDTVLAIIRSDADTAATSKAWKSVDLATVRSLEIVRAPEAAARYPAAVGDVLRIIRCY